MKTSQAKGTGPFRKGWRGWAEVIALVVTLFVVCLGPEWVVPWAMAGLFFAVWMINRQPIE